MANVFERYGEAEGEWLAGQIADYWARPENEDLECVDNTRVAREDIESERFAYNEARDNGCCGSCDVEFGPSPGGFTYWYGFNFGH